jgi:predicted nucleic acid-binding protein
VKIIVDTCIWSLALRRDHGKSKPLIEELRSLILDRRVQMLGPIRQEILSGIRREDHFQILKNHLAAFPDFPLLSEDYETAASYFNLCRRQGMQGSNTDFLICAVAARANFSVFSTDKDFELFAEHLPIMLHNPPGTA